MSEHRITEHPILPIPNFEEIEFYWQDIPLKAHKGETIAAALFAMASMCLVIIPRMGPLSEFFVPMGNVHNAWLLPMVCH